MTVVRRAPAKINLSLDLIRKRPDGFHELRTVMQTLDLADDLTFDPADNFVFQCDDPELANDGNLVVRAARALADAAAVPCNARISLRKHIPAAAGLGGGSSDAAACLAGLAELWGLRMSIERLSDIAASLGSDIPFFLRGGTALAEGRGDIVTPIPPAPPMDVVLLFGVPAPTDKTRQIFSRVQLEDFSDGSRTDRLIEQLKTGHIDPGTFSNDLTAPAERAFRSLALDREMFLAAGARHVLLAGAGPTQFAVASDAVEAALWRDRLVALGKDSLVTITR